MESLAVERVVGEVPDEFVCSICCGLVPYDGASQTPCHHLFCTACIGQWLARGARQACPECQAPVQRAKLAQLRAASPIMHRMLGKIKVMCAQEGCTWRGDYSGLAQHDASCRAACSTCPDCGTPLLPNARDMHTIPCLRLRLRRMEEEKARLREQLEEERRAWESERSLLQMRLREARVAERLEEIFTSAIDQIETALPSDPSGGRTNSVLPPLARAERYGPHDLGGLAALLAGCVGGQPPVGVSREHVFNALVACVREKDRCTYSWDEAQSLLLMLVAADQCGWFSQKQLDRIGTFLQTWGQTLLNSRLNYHNC